MARSRSRSRVALPTKAALIIGAAEPAAALHLGRGIVLQGLGGAKYIGADAPALCGASDRRATTTIDGPACLCLDGGCDMATFFWPNPTRKPAIPRCAWPSPGANPPSPGVSGHPQV